MLAWVDAVKMPYSRAPPKALFALEPRSPGHSRKEKQGPPTSNLPCSQPLPPEIRDCPGVLHGLELTFFPGKEEPSQGGNTLESATGTMRRPNVGRSNTMPG
jgi:hypothetical protein